MKLVLKIVGALVALVVVAIAGFAVYVSVAWDKDHGKTELPAITASQDPEVIKRGEYIAHSVAHCSICHAPREVTEKRQPGEHPAMAGGFEWKMGPLGTLYSRNITPDQETGIGSWSDPELARAIKWGVGRDGKLLTFMAMAAPPMSDEDVTAVVSYLRSTPAVKQANKPHEAGLILKFMSMSLGPDFRQQFFDKLKYAAPADEPSLARGEYLARGPGACVGCHTQYDMMTMTPTHPDFSGSAMAEPDPEDPSKVYRMPNLTPAPKTGHMTSWTEDFFVERFRTGRVLKTSKMPWEAFREMTDADLRSVYRYLSSLPPTEHYIGPSIRSGDDDPAKDEAAQGPPRAERYW